MAKSNKEMIEILVIGDSINFVMTSDNMIDMPLTYADYYKEALTVTIIYYNTQALIMIDRQASRIIDYDQ